MSDITEYELHSQGGVIAMSPKYDGRDPMRNRPHSNGTDTTMPITRYGLGREYAGNTGSPAITEQADGAYVRYEDFQKMEAGYKNHNDLMVLRTKKAEGALDSENAVPVAYYYQYEDGWTAQCRFEGPGPLAVKPLYTAPVAAQPDPAMTGDFPMGAIENGRAFAERLEADYDFSCGAGRLQYCTDWQEYRRCFEFLAEWAQAIPAQTEPVMASAEWLHWLSEFLRDYAHACATGSPTHRLRLNEVMEHARKRVHQASGEDV